MRKKLITGIAALLILIHIFPALAGEVVPETVLSEKNDTTLEAAEAKEVSSDADEPCSGLPGEESDTKLAGTPGISFRASSQQITYPEPYSITAFDGETPVDPDKVTWYISNETGQISVEKYGNPLELPFSVYQNDSWYCVIEGIRQPFLVNSEVLGCEKKTPDRGMFVIFNNGIVAPGETVTVPSGFGSGSLSLFEDGRTLVIDHLHLDPDGYQPDYGLKRALYVESGAKEDYEIIVKGECDLLYRDIPVKSDAERNAALFAFAPGNEVKIIGEEDAVLKFDGISLKQYTKTTDMPNTFRFENLKLIGRSYGNSVLSVDATYAVFDNCVIDLYTDNGRNACRFSDTSYLSNTEPDKVTFNNCTVRIENGFHEPKSISADGSIYIFALVTDNEMTEFINTNAEILVDHVLAGETVAIRALSGEVVVDGGTLRAIVKREDADIDRTTVEAAIQAVSFTAKNKAKIEAFCETEETRATSPSGILYARDVTIQNASVDISVKGGCAQGIYYYGPSDPDRFVGNVTIENCDLNIHVAGTSSRYRSVAISGRSVTFTGANVSLQAEAPEETFAPVVMAYTFNDACGIFVNEERFIEPEEAKIEKIMPGRSEGYGFVDSKGDLVEKLVLTPSRIPVPSDSSSSEDTEFFTGTWNSPVKNGIWKQDANGIWSYTTSQVFRNTWGYIVNPFAKEGQHQADWFWFDQYGHMLTGWQLIGGKWYYLNPTKDGTLGACLLGPGKTPDGWEIDASGAWTGR